MSSTIRLTSKRQATFPVEVCEALGLEPGDEIELIPVTREGERCWHLRPKKLPDRSWLGSLQKYGAKVKEHSMAAIRESIERGRTKGR